MWNEEASRKENCGGSYKDGNVFLVRKVKKQFWIERETEGISLL